MAPRGRSQLLFTLLLLTVLCLWTLPAMAQQVPPAPPTPPAGISVAPAAKIDRGDNAWMLMSAALVLMMTAPGLALFYGGMVGA